MIRNPNPLAAWLSQQPDGTKAKRRLATDAGLRWQTVHLVAAGEQLPSPETAQAIERATGGAVSGLGLVAWFYTQRTASEAGQ